MQFETFEAFLSMGGYGFYVWLSFAVTLISMALIAVVSRYQHAYLMKKVVQEKRRIERLRRAKLR